MVDSTASASGQTRLAPGLVGRVAEISEIDRFLDASRTGLHALLLSGQAGIGKTSIWKAAIERATQRGVRVLVSRPTEVETQLSFAALVDLLDDLADEVLPQLPEPQRQALGAALLRISPGAAPPPLGVSLGVLAALRGVAESGPVLIAIDDVPWLDPSSVAALEFAVRRLEDAPVGLLAAQRTDGAPAALPPLLAAIPAERRSEIEVTRLSVDDIAEIVARVLGVDLRRPTLVRIHALTGGNAFYALEVARALQRHGSAGGEERLPLPATLDALLHDRIDALPAASLDLALSAAAMSPPARATLDAALGAERVRAGIEAGVASGVFEADEDPLRFSHPLLAAAIYGRASAETRRDVHRSLAAVITEPEERARHLALAVDVPEAAVAAALEQAAGTARARGAAVAAAELADASVRLTPEADDEDRRRRAFRAADHHLTAGDVPLARARLDQLLTETPTSERGPILAQLGQILIFLAEMDRARSAFEEGLALAGDDLALRVRTEMGLAGCAFLTGLNWDAGARQIAAALEDAESLGDGPLILQAIGHYATWQFALGRGLSAHLVDRAASLEAWRPDVVVLEHPDLQFARIHLNVGDTANARRLCERLLGDARQRGDWSSQPYLYDELSLIEEDAGRWDLAAQHIRDSHAAAVQSGQQQSIVDGGNAYVRLLALRGDVVECRAAAERFLGMSEAAQVPGITRGLLTSLGFLELSVGDAAAAHERLQTALEFVPQIREEPTFLGAVPLAAEALVGLGRLDEADAMLEPFERLARRRRRKIAIGEGARCRALLLAARLDLDQALDAAGTATAAFQSLELPFETARTALVRGEILRRARKKAAARDALTEALTTFERLGAERWADRARAALGRSDARRGSAGVLTETQMRVAQLAAAGQTNREIADALFMSAHTVEAHLTQIYRILGVHTRTELARASLDRPSS